LIKKFRFNGSFLPGVLSYFFLKTLAFALTNSVGILSDALESTVNIITGYITLQSLVFASKPRDEDHPYGHGKVELITASVEGILIGVAGILIMVEAIHRLNESVVITKINTGMVLMSLTALANVAMGKYSIAMGKKHNSIALVAGGKHLISDMYSTLALIAGLIAFSVTGLMWIDSVLAIAFGLFILYTAYGVLKQTVNGLMDETNPEVIRKIVATINEHRRDPWIDIHRLTHLTFGHVAHVDMHLTLPWYYQISQANEEVVFLKKVIRLSDPEMELDISIQSEPCIPAQCIHCAMECNHRTLHFEEKNFLTPEKVTGKNRFPNHNS